MPDGATPRLPAWPRALRAPLAAAYVGLSTSTFHQAVAPAVPAVRLTPGCVAWLREDLDRWLDGRRAQLVDAPPLTDEAPATRATDDSRAYRDEIRARLKAKRGPRRPHQAG